MSIILALVLLVIFILIPAAKLFWKLMKFAFILMIIAWLFSSLF